MVSILLVKIIESHVRKETLAYNPNDHARSVMDKSNGWCSHCKTYHLESFGADPFQHPTECPQPITGIFIDGDAGDNSTFGGHDNMVGKRIFQEFLNLQHRKTLAMVGDEAMTSQKCIYCLHQTKKATKSIYEEEGGFPIKSIPSRGAFICTNHFLHLYEEFSN